VRFCGQPRDRLTQHRRQRDKFGVRRRSPGPAADEAVATRNRTLVSIPCGRMGPPPRSFAADDPGRNASYLAPPGQIRARGTTARGSYFECLAAKRTLGQG